MVSTPMPTMSRLALSQSVASPENPGKLRSGKPVPPRKPSALSVREDRQIPFEQGRLMTSLLPNARFVPLEGRNHLMLEDEPAWTRFVAEVQGFLRELDD